MTITQYGIQVQSSIHRGSLSGLKAEASTHRKTFA